MHLDCKGVRDPQAVLDREHLLHHDPEQRHDFHPLVILPDINEKFINQMLLRPAFILSAVLRSAVLEHEARITLFKKNIVKVVMIF